ncbi:hypothetical protein Aple_064290 [Acrocarpospora pleiomorpha]|uniref:Uncharacterized protein n=1 Tax=Acrocarpospora pleiomorpha TaxID=90975 RepID=A0A5M3XRU0_9ACTN|nr:hypothetical protein [Acrocarpospora pleiomorpha]GES23530.1 hypothetical protein Aple_064290 [Acrocarpospora pleiomorpha]
MSRRRKQSSGHPAKRAAARTPGKESPLLRAAAATPVMRGLRGLAAWVGDGVAVTDTGVPRPGDIPDLCQALGLEPPPIKIRTASRVPWLMSLWAVARAADVIQIKGRKARPGAGLAVDALETWRNAFVRTVDGDDEEFIEGAEGGALVALQVLANVPAGSAVDEAALDATIRAAAEAEGVTFDVAAGLDLLAFFGAVRRDPGRATLTPLGAHLVTVLHELTPA